MTTVRNLLWSSCALALLTSLPVVVSAQEQRMVEDLRGNWKFQIGDDQRWADPSFNDGKWDDIFVPSPWENEGYPGYDGYAWYRRRFVAQGDWEGKVLSLHMGTINEFISAAEYIVSFGNPSVILCPRGTAPALDGYRNHPDEAIVPLLKERTWAPVVVDPSHSVGKAAYVPACALAAIAYGADGLCIEAHVLPSKGIGDDPKQAVTPVVLTETIRRAREVWALRRPAV